MPLSKPTDIGYRTAPGTSPRRSARVARDGRLLFFEPALDAVRGRLFRYGIADDTGDANHSNLQRSRIFHCFRTDQGVLRGVTYAALLPVVTRIYSRQGFAIDQAGVSAPPCELQLDWSLVESDANDRAVIEFVHRNAEGLIRYSASSVDPACLIAQLAKAFPRARVVAVSESRKLGRRLASRLRQYVGRVIFADARSNLSYFDEEPRFAVSTLTGLAELEVEKVDLLLFLRVQDVAIHRAEVPLGRAERARMFGLVPLGATMAPCETDLMRCVFGFNEIAVPAHGKIVRPVEVVSADLWGGSHAQSQTIVEAMHNYAWRDPVRLRRVTKLARLIQCGDIGKLYGEFRTIADVVSSRSIPGHALMVICDCLEQMANISKALPDWLCVPNMREVATSWPSRMWVVITTRDAIAEGALDLSGVDVAIYAGASPHPIVIPPDLLACDPANSRPLLLIDFRDNRHPLLRRWSRQRAAAYAAAGWFPFGVDPVETRVDRFVAERRSR
jgi:hypothetical protein